jgi:acetylornithine deacetylase/succinyl-diaminopimelate desuccinylase-like protein
VLADAVVALESAAATMSFPHSAGAMADEFCRAISARESGAAEAAGVAQAAGAAEAAGAAQAAGVAQAAGAAEAAGAAGTPSGVGADLCKYIQDVSMTVNYVDAGRTVNAVPSPARAEVEIRVPPGVGKEPIDEAVHQALAPVTAAGKVGVEQVEYEPGFLSALDSPLFVALKNEVARSGGVLAPIIALGRTDGRFFGWRGCNVYGFSPTLPDIPFDQVLGMVHGADEQISRASLEWGTQVLVRCVVQVCIE